MGKGPKLFLTTYFTLGLVGPVLSYFSLQGVGFSPERALLYSLLTFLFDGLSVLFFALYIKRRWGGEWEGALDTSTLVYLPLWLFDFFDISQSLRPLSNLALPLSLYLIYKSGKERVPFKEILLGETLFLVLYTLNGLTAELIASSPLFKRLLGSI
ncbi:hypothetical protein [Thermovibrio sp.]